MPTINDDSCPSSSLESTADILLRVAERHPLSGVYTNAGVGRSDFDFMAYPDLLREARCLLSGLDEHLPRSLTNVVLLLHRARDLIPALWACLLGGYVPCPWSYISNDRERWDKSVAHIDRLLGHPLFVVSRDLKPELPHTVDSVDIASLRKRPLRGDSHRPRPADLALLMLTSGSTGNPKAVELTHSNLLCSLHARVERQAIVPSDIMLNWVSFDHVAAVLESHMTALYAGATHVNAEPGVLSDPINFLRIVDQFRISIAFAPNYLLGQINAAVDSGSYSERFDLSCLRRIVTGGEANVVHTGCQFLNLLQPGRLHRRALWPAFGMTETCAACVYSSGFPDEDLVHEFASVGRPVSGLEIRIADEYGRQLAEEHIGELQVRGTMVFRGYHNDPRATEAAFTPDGWFRTGDVGRMIGDRLNLIARSKDNIIVNGVNYFSHELESRIGSLPGIEKSFVAAFPIRPTGADTEELVIAFASVYEEGRERELCNLVRAVRNTTMTLWGFKPFLVLPVPKAAFPKTSLGKTQRSLMRHRLESGSYHAHMARVEQIVEWQSGPYVAPSGRVQEELAVLFSNALGIDRGEISATVSFFDLGGTSLEILKITQSLRQKFGLDATLPMLIECPSIHSLAARIASRHRRQTHEHRYNPIVSLQASGEGEPLFCVHPGNGEVFVLANVAQRFANYRPFFALRPPGFHPHEQHFAAFDEMIETYISAIRERQPRGPYLIAGYSLGCEIAFEIAKRLKHAGSDIAFLGCIDSAPRIETRPLPFNIGVALAQVLDLIDREKAEVLNQQFQPEQLTDDVCEHILSFASTTRLAQLHLDLQKFATWARTAYSIERLVFSNETSGSVAAMTVFCGEGVSARYTEGGVSREQWRAALDRWTRFSARCRFIDVAGDHHSLLGPGHASAFQAALRSEIDLAVQMHGSNG